MISSYIKLIRIGILAAAIAVAGISMSRCSRAIDAIETLESNVIHYQDMYYGGREARAVLEIESDRLRYTNDMLVREIDSIARRRDIDLRKKGSMAAKVSTNINTSDTVIVDTDSVIARKDTMAIKSCDFKVIIRPNDQTTYNIERKNDSIIHNADINNEQFLFVYPNREYLNKGKSFFKRLFTWDFKKVDLTRYEIENTNDEIEITDTKVFVVN